MNEIAPTILLFWSFKGGQGRSWCCSNLALDLALHRGARVLLIDLDYRAPGLHHYFRRYLSQPIESCRFGILEALHTWFQAYSLTFDPDRSGPPEVPGLSITDKSYFEYFVRKYRLPDSTHSEFAILTDDWSADDARDQSLFGAVQAVELPKPDELFSPASEIRRGQLHLAHCGNIKSPDFRHFFGEGFPWASMKDPQRWGMPAHAPLGLGEIFYSLISVLARECQADYVLIDLPAGSSALNELMMAPSDPEPPERQPRCGPDGLVVVTSASEQSLDGVSMLLKGQLLKRSGGRPSLVSQDRTIVCYNFLADEEPAVRPLLEHYGDLIDHRIDFMEGSWIPSDGFRAWSELSFVEWLIPLKRVEHPYVRQDLVREQTLQMMYESTMPAVRRWTSIKEESEGHLIRLRKRGFFGVHKGVNTRGLVDELVIAVEDVPPVDLFVGLLMETLPGIKQVTVWRFNHDDLFKAILRPNQSLDHFKQQLFNGTNGERATGMRATKEIWRPGNATERGSQEFSFPSADSLLQETNADIVAVPHYMLGSMFNRGIADLEDQLGTESRGNLAREVTRFEELCCYRDVWCAIPFTALVKLIVSRIELDPSERHRFRDLANKAKIELLGKREDGWFLTESKANSLSLWYEWDQILVCTGAKLLHRTSGWNVARLISQDGAEKEAVFAATRLYWQLINSQKEEDIGHVDWIGAFDCFFRTPTQYKYWLAWSDWCQSVKTEDPKCAFAPMPVEEVSAPRQPLEGWVFVVPYRDPATEAVADRTQAVARTLYATTSFDWQRKFQSRCGTSAYTKVLQDVDVQKQQSWASVVLEAMRNATTKGTTPIVPLYAQAIIWFLTKVLYDFCDDRPRLVSERQLRLRFDEHWNSFYQTLNQLRHEERVQA